MPATTTQSRRKRELDAWIAEVQHLAQQVAAWCDQRGWSASRTEKQLTESAYGTYVAPELMIHSPSGVVYLEPVARDVAGANGRVDLVAWPSLTRMMLVRKAKQWVLQTDSGIDWPESWSQPAFERIVGLINSAA